MNSITKIQSTGFIATALSKLNDVAMLTKFRLSFLVVFSAVIGFLYPVVDFHFVPVLVLSLGGFLVTASSNAINQILEKETDKLMPRTANRPLPTGRMKVIEAVFTAGLMGISGIAILSFYFNTLAGVLSALSLLSYAFVYTPMKRYSPVAVFIGAFPGALPVLIGYVCATGTIDFTALILFSIQFLWQFPHFWSIAWVSFDDYLKGGFMLLPSSSGKSKATAMQCVVYSTFLLIVSMMPYFLDMITWQGALVILVMSAFFLFQSIQLYYQVNDRSARNLMFGSFAFLPVVQLALLFSKMQTV